MPLSLSARTTYRSTRRRFHHHHDGGGGDGGLRWWWRGGGFTNHTPASEYRVCFIEVVARSSQTQRHSITQSTHMCVISVAWCVCYSVVDRKPFKCSTHSKPNQISFSWLRTVVDNERSFLSLLFNIFASSHTRIITAFYSFYWCSIFFFFFGEFWWLSLLTHQKKILRYTVKKQQQQFNLKKKNNNKN